MNGKKIATLCEKVVITTRDNNKCKSIQSIREESSRTGTSTEISNNNSNLTENEQTQLNPEHHFLSTVNEGGSETIIDQESTINYDDEFFDANDELL